MSDEQNGPDCNSCNIGTVDSRRWVIGSFAGYLAWSIFTAFVALYVFIVVSAVRAKTNLDSESQITAVKLRGRLAAELLRIDGISPESVSVFLTSVNPGEVEIEATTEASRLQAKAILERYSNEAHLSQAIVLWGIVITRTAIVLMSLGLLAAAVPTSVIGAMRKVWVCPSCRKFWDRC